MSEDRKDEGGSGVNEDPNTPPPTSDPPPGGGSGARSTDPETSVQGYTAPAESPLGYQPDSDPTGEPPSSLGTVESEPPSGTGGG